MGILCHLSKKCMDDSSNEGQVIYNLYYIVNGCLQVFKFKIRGYKMCTAFSNKISTNSYTTVMKKKFERDLQFSYNKHDC